eukprot:g1579.t1
MFAEANACVEEDADKDVTTKCLTRDELYDINPKYRMNVENYIEQTLLCVTVDNSPSAGSFFEDPGTVNVNSVFCQADVAPSFMWTQNGICTSSSDRYEEATTSTYTVGDSLPLAFLNVASNSAEIARGGYLSIAASGIDGACNDQNPVGFMQNTETTCSRLAVNSVGTCADATLSAMMSMNATSFLVGVAPSSAGSPSTGSFVPLTVARTCFFNATTDTISSCSVLPAQVPEPANLGGGTGCANVLKEMHIVVKDDGNGAVSSTEVDLVLFSEIQASSETFVTQSYSVSFETNYTNQTHAVTTSWELGNLIARPRSGNAGYQDAYPVNAGTQEVQTIANVTKRAVRMLVDGLHVTSPSALGGCDTTSVATVGFGQNVKTGCAIQLDRAALQDACNAFANNGTLPVSLSDFWTDVIAGNTVPMIGKYGNSDPLDFDDWVQLNMESISTFSDVTLYNTLKRQCDNIVTSVNIELLYAYVGEEGNPQPKIVAARTWYGTDTWRFRGEDRSGLKQSFAFYTTVTFVPYNTGDADDAVPPSPDLLPTLPHDLWYPFTLSAGTRGGEVSLVSVVVASLFVALAVKDF